MGLVKIPAIVESASGGGDTPDVSPPGNGMSLGFDSSVESLADNTVNCEHCKNKFTIAMWLKEGTAASSGNFLHLVVDPDANASFRYDGTATTSQRIIMRDPGSSTVIKDYFFATAAFNTWLHVVMLVEISADNPTNEQLIIYVNGVKVTPTKSVDTTLLSREGIVVNKIQQIGDAANVNIHSFAIWNKILKSKEITAIYNNGVGTVNLSKRHGSYRSQKKLQHWWFFDTTVLSNVGRDYGKARTSEPTDILQNAVNITAADLEIDAPGY